MYHLHLLYSADPTLSLREIFCKGGKDQLDWESAGECQCKCSICVCMCVCLNERESEKFSEFFFVRT